MLKGKVKSVLTRFQVICCTCMYVSSCVSTYILFYLKKGAPVLFMSLFKLKKNFCPFKKDREYSAKFQWITY